MELPVAMRPLGLEDYLDIWRRRQLLFLSLAFLAASAGLLVVALLPSVYRSEALILLEPPRVSESYLRPVVGTDLNRDLSGLIQEALSRTRVENLIREYGLYPIEPGAAVPERVVAEVRSYIQIEVLRGPAGWDRAEPYGLRLSFSAGSPELAQKVTSELVSFFVAGEHRLQEEGAEEARRLFAEQLRPATLVVEEKERQLRDFKLRYSGQLPVQERLLVETLTRLQDRLQAQERAREGGPFSPGEGSAAGTRPSTQQQRLEALEARLAELESRYTAGHPDIVKTEEEIAVARRELEASAAEAAGTGEEPPLGRSASARSLTNAVRSNPGAQDRERQALEREIRRYEADLKAVPLRAYQLAELEREYEAAKEKLNLLKERQSQVELASQAVHGLAGRRFLIQDYPSFPLRPHGPRRMRLSGLALAAGVFFGLVVTGAWEFRDHSLKSEKDVEFYLGLPVLANVPEWLTPTEQARARRRRALWMGLGAVGVAAMITALAYIYTRV